MIDKLNDIDFYFITDSSLSKNGIINDVKAAIKAGCKIVQYREKNKSTKDMLEEAKEIKKLCKSKAIFLVNDRIDIALAVDADGVHIGQEDIPYKHARNLLGKNKIIGLSAHSLKDALQNQRAGADYTSIGPIYPTSTKKFAKPLGLAPIRQLKSKLKIPLVAIGGINKNNIAQVIKSGADAAAAISTVISSKDVQKEVSDFIGIIKNNKK